MGKMSIIPMQQEPIPPQNVSQNAARWNRLFQRLVHFPARLHLWLKNASIKKCFIVLTIVHTVLAFIILGLIGSALTDWSYSQSKNYRIYNDGDGKSLTEEEYYDELQSDNILAYSYYSGLPAYLEFINNWGAIIIIFGGAFLTISLDAAIFYNLKLKIPLRLLKNAAKRIAENDLDFTLYYGFDDEMGKLCNAFEKTRVQLEDNNKNMWRMMEDRKRLNAAFAHDLRTPITVLKGYTEFLQNYVPQGRISEEKLLTTVKHMGGAVSRLESYVDVMSSIQKLEDIEAQPQQVNPAAFSQKLQEDFSLMAAECGKELVFRNECSHLPQFDERLALRVTENLISNALRYAEKAIFLTLAGKGIWLRIIVADDGPGFSKTALHKGAEPFFRDKAAKGEHFGMGLNICKTLCEKHGGRLILENNTNGGACITAVLHGE